MMIFKNFIFRKQIGFTVSGLAGAFLGHTMLYGLRKYDKKKTKK